MTQAGSGRPRTVVLGLGNPVRQDDGVGLRVAEEVGRLLDGAPVRGVTVATSTRAGLELIDLLAGFHHAVLVDALVTPDAVPGRVRRLTPDDVAGSARLIGAHDIGVRDAIALGRAAGIEMPGVVEIVAVEIVDDGTIGETLSEAVEAAVAPLAREIHRQLEAGR